MAAEFSFAAYLTLTIMAIGWLWQCVSRNAAIADVLWALCILLNTLVFSITYNAPLWLVTVVGLLLVVWSSRLTALLGIRVFRHGEDRRYVAMRRAIPAPIQPLFYLAFFGLQALLALLFSYPAWQLMQIEQPTAPWFVFLGALVCAVGLWGEARADRQLLEFKSRQSAPGGICDEGLWAWSRHPNYFFEWVFWCGIGLMGLASQHSWALIGYPVLMFLFLYFITGIPFNERQMAASRGAAWDAYAARTPAFFPRRPRP